mmetsp:Transcript_32429/g.87034  ORF Transcript_32429/g.87034 Transcript_32429/m.87034 type:complete len:211 (+) Transcript_32429:1359-1991(+)
MHIQPLTLPLKEAALVHLPAVLILQRLELCPHVTVGVTHQLEMVVEFVGSLGRLLHHLTRGHARIRHRDMYRNCMEWLLHWCRNAAHNVGATHEQLPRLTLGRWLLCNTVKLRRGPGPHHACTSSTSRTRRAKNCQCGSHLSTGWACQSLHGPERSYWRQVGRGGSSSLTTQCRLFTGQRPHQRQENVSFVETLSSARTCKDLSSTVGRF